MQTLIDFCPYCNSEKYTFSKKVFNNKLYECDSCYLKFFSPRIFDENLYLSEDESHVFLYSEYHKVRKHATMWLKGLISALTKKSIILSNKKILEIGAGDGLNYEFLKQEYNILPEDYHILELAPKSVAAARSRGIVITFTEYFDRNFALSHKEMYDIVIITEVIEHQTNLNEFLEAIKLLLKSNGLVLITTPNEERIFLTIGEKTDAPPHHFLRFNSTFFKKNFKNSLIFLDYYYFDHRTIIEYSKAVSLSKFSIKSFWFLFYPLFLFKGLLGVLLKQGEGLIIFLKK